MNSPESLMGDAEEDDLSSVPFAPEHLIPPIEEEFTNPKGLVYAEKVRRAHEYVRVTANGHVAHVLAFWFVPPDADEVEKNLIMFGPIRIVCTRADGGEPATEINHAVQSLKEEAFMAYSRGSLVEAIVQGLNGHPMTADECAYVVVHPDASRMGELAAKAYGYPPGTPLWRILMDGFTAETQPTPEGVLRFALIHPDGRRFEMLFPTAHWGPDHGMRASHRPPLDIPSCSNVMRARGDWRPASWRMT